MTFNNDETAKGFNSLTDHMIQVIEFINYYVKAKYNKNIRITDTHRTQESQDHIYRNNPRYKIKPWPSVHQQGRGVDISIKGYTPAMIRDIVVTANRIKYSDKYKIATHHDVGAGDHLHFQVPYSICKQPEEL